MTPPRAERLKHPQVVRILCPKCGEVAATIRPGGYIHNAIESEPEPEG